MCMLFRAHKHAPAPIPWIPRMGTDRRCEKMRRRCGTDEVTTRKFVGVTSSVPHLPQILDKIAAVVAGMAQENRKLKF